jgi:hypothetical protein
MGSPLPATDWSLPMNNCSGPPIASLGKPLKAGEFSLDRRPWPKTTTLVEPGHRSAGNRGLSSPLRLRYLADNKAVV